MSIALFPIVLIIAGLLMYMLAPGRWGTIGLVMFAAGLLVLTEVWGHRTVKIG